MKTSAASEARSSPSSARSGQTLEAGVNYRFVDADQHLYEPPDAYSRHLEQKYSSRALTLGPGIAPGAQRWLFDGESVLPDHYERVMEPGAWKRVFSHTGEGKVWESDDVVIHPWERHPEITHRDGRLAWMDEHNIEATVLIPTAVCDTLASCGDMPLFYAHMRSFNRYLEDDWGYRYRNRIFAVPQLSLDDPELAIEELDRLIRAGTRFVLLPPCCGACNISPGDPRFDPFWERLVEAAVIPVIHLSGHSPYWEYAGRWGEPTQGYPVTDAGTPRFTAFQEYLAFVDRPIMDYIAALILHNLFGRVPGLRVMIVENGIGWVPYLLTQLDKCYRMAWDSPWLGGRPRDLPSELFKRHFYLSPFLGDRIVETMRLLGPGRLMLGTDFPHPEGVTEPADFLAELAGQPETVVKSFMRDTAAELYGLQA